MATIERAIIRKRIMNVKKRRIGVCKRYLIEHRLQQLKTKKNEMRYQL